ncbi:hypothetical protein V9W64_00005 [Neisseria leonii]|uniref:Uncharacterized protein n=1 Tax=Neisseria leonii TaxID=2995413 RepID=A0A9X4E0J9_9NEIS|nr:hypothetical protein [Neisseria sp. 51.81]MDD9326759.1 hypothetical protein [Neisseria sp. 51.81]
MNEVMKPYEVAFVGSVPVIGVELPGGQAVGRNGKDGRDGADGKSAYQLAVDNGFEGTVEEWLNSLRGRDGKDGTGEEGGGAAPGLRTYRVPGRYLPGCFAGKVECIAVISGHLVELTFYVRESDFMPYWPPGTPQEEIDKFLLAQTEWPPELVPRAGSLAFILSDGTSSARLALHKGKLAANVPLPKNGGDEGVAVLTATFLCASPQVPGDWEVEPPRPQFRPASTAWYWLDGEAEAPESDSAPGTDGAGESG